jgi:cell division protein FtsQ
VTDPRFRQRRIDVAREVGRKRLRVVVAVLMAVALTALVLGVLHSPLFSVRHVRVVGAPGVSRAAVLTASGLESHPPLVDVDPGQVAKRVEQLPQVATVTVHEQWPTGVEIVLTQREGVAAAFARGGGGYAELDPTGHVIADTTDAPAGLPLLDLPLAPGPPGTVVGAPDLPLIDVAMAIPSTLEGEVTSVGYDGAGEAVLQLHDNLVVVLGQVTALRQKVQALEVILQQVPTSGISTIDVSVPTAPVLTPTGDGPTVQGIVGG